MNTMTADRETETSSEKKPVPRAVSPTPGAEAGDKESASRAESADSRETVERGYGWGV